MGLRQEAETSVGNQSGRRLPHPVSAGFSRFETRFSRRSFNSSAAALGTLTAVGIPLSALAQEQPAEETEVEAEQDITVLSDFATNEALTIENLAAHQRVVNNLRELLESRARSSAGVMTTNPEGIDPDEIAEFAANPEKEVFNTFRIWSKPNGDPWGIIVTGERPEEAPVQGLVKPENVVNLMAGLDRLYATDPQIFDTLEQYGLIAVAGNVPGFKTSGASATFGNGRIYLNEVGNYNPVAQDPVEALNHMYTTLVETRHMYNITHPSVDLLDPHNLGIDKALWASQFLDAHLSAFTSGEQRAWRSWSRQTITFYTNNPTIGVNPVFSR